MAALLTRVVVLVSVYYALQLLDLFLSVHHLFLFNWLLDSHPLLLIWLLASF